ncbi:HAD superfamily hydrolase (TIGR01450 family) [Propionicimonas paludicola]|uniref:HAD superfamily hydrolase (TIGR01450 family) n=1 Tax=Propionicimonas paludicola TaxID=185243 RepID=A0A2A9CQ28_9ACTN|nr:HAD-IIA family hydrolase [Propionicimonas paludicola]PFG16503.1 HAD superfamily hydrolase (TIGR01450 family) [Propionicimonas paludicola]
MRLIDGYDAALFDLDGVLYLGPMAVPGAVAALQELDREQVRVLYVTNNAAREARVVIDQLRSLGYSADEHNVLTSAQVAAAALVEELPPGAKVLCAGSPNLAGLLERAGFEVVYAAADDPVAVIQGYHPKLDWRMLDEVSLAIQGGAKWYATNDDASRPTERGLVPGVGGAISVIRLVVGGEPTIFGKPHRPMLREAIRRSAASRPIFVGDRLDTDVSGANGAGIDSLLVFTGAHGKFDLVQAEPELRPTHIGAGVAALLDEPRPLNLTPDQVTCRDQTVRVESGRTVLAGGVPVTEDEQLDAVWAVAHLVWSRPELDYRETLESLTLVN